MSFMRGLSRWLMSFLVALLISLWLMAATLQMTVLNRNMVSGWLQESGLYQNFIDAIPLEIPGVAADQSFVTATDIKQALAATFPASFLQTHTEAVLNATYDWLEAKQPKISFSIPIDQKKAEFATNLAKQLQPKLAALPACKSLIASSNNQPTCLPKGMSAASYADQLAHITNSQGQDFLDKPLTQNSFGQNSSPAASWLRLVASQLSWMVIVLPILALLAATGYVLLSDNKMKGLATLGRRAFFQGLIICVIGGLIWYFGQSLTLDSLLPTGEGSEVGQAIAKNLAEPLLHAIMPGIGQVMVLLAGGLTIVGGSTWLTGHIIGRRQEDQKRHFEHTVSSQPPPNPGDQTPLQPPAAT